MPKTNVYTRINIHWQEVLTAWTPQNELYFSFHTALTPLSVGPLLTDLFRVCNSFELVLTRDETYADGGEMGGRIGEVLADLVEEDPDDEIAPGYAAALDNALATFFGRHPNLEIENSQYRPGGWDQVRLVVAGAEDALRLLQDNEVGLAIRNLNLRLMCKGPSPYRTSHCLDLADIVLNDQASG